MKIPKRIWRENPIGSLCNKRKKAFVDPTHLRDLLLYRLTLEAQKRVAESPLSKTRDAPRHGWEPSSIL